MRIEVHVLQNFAPSNLNRDDTGSPKDAEFGGHRRARVSSQCLKRAVREYFKKHELIPTTHLATRTNRLLLVCRERLARDGREESRIDLAVITALAAGKIAMKKDKGKQHLTEYLLFLGENEIAKFVEVVDRHFDVLAPEAAKALPIGDDSKKKKTARQQKAAAKEAAPDEVQRAIPQLLDGGKAADLALFGRMLADLSTKNVDAACQVAHCISTNKIHSMSLDYFTAVDDLKELARKQGKDEDAGAGMIESTAFNSACFYRYANLDVTQLRKNLQDDEELTRKTAEAFLTAFVHAIPTGKQNTFAAQNPPSLVFAVVRTGSPVSLTNAFVRPIAPRGDQNLVEESITALDKYYGRLTKMYGDGGLKQSAVCQVDGVELEHLKEDVGSVENLIAAIVTAAFPAGGAA